MDRWLVVFALGGWFCFMASAVVAMWKWKQLAEEHDVEMEYQRFQTIKARGDVKKWQRAHTELKRSVAARLMAEEDAKKIVAGGGDDYYDGS